MYIDSANVKEIKECIQLGIFKGVTTNPTLLLKENKDRILQLKKIANLEIGQLFIQLEGATVAELLEDLTKIKQSLDVQHSLTEIIYKIAIDKAGLMAIKAIKEHQPNLAILGTVIYSTEQIYLASLAGCSYVAPYINRMENFGINPYEVISAGHTYLSGRNSACQIMGASFKNVLQVKSAYNAGASSVTLPKEILNKMLEQDNVTRAISQFNQDGKQLIKQVSKGE